MLQGQLDTSVAACAKQEAVNKQLMDAKTQVEWQLLDVRADVNDASTQVRRAGLSSLISQAQHL